MPNLQQKTSTRALPQIQCGSCQLKLPLRLTVGDEPAAVWLCASCQVPYVACCVEEALKESAHLIRLAERSFDVSNQPPFSLTQRRQAIQLASRSSNPTQIEKRRYARISKSIAVPATELGTGLVPIGNPFQIMVFNVSKDGVGLIHDGPIKSANIAIEFSPTSHSPVQMIVNIVRQRELVPPYYELGGEFLARLGSVPQS